MHKSIYAKLKNPLSQINNILLINKGQNIKYICRYMPQVRQREP